MIQAPKNTRFSPTLPPSPTTGAAKLDARVTAVTNFARQCRYEMEHTHQVTRLALCLFDRLHALHALGASDRFLLWCGAMLHDIGWIKGRKAHHKTAMQLIMAADDLPLNDPQRRIVALIARYHRKALPSKRHILFNELSTADQKKVKMLAALLRLADGMDRSHRSVVRDLRCRIDAQRIRVRIIPIGPASAEQRYGDQKADLLREVTGRKVEIELISSKQHSPGLRPKPVKQRNAAKPSK